MTATSGAPTPSRPESDPSRLSDVVVVVVEDLLLLLMMLLDMNCCCWKENGRRKLDDDDDIGDDRLLELVGRLEIILDDSSA